MPLNKETKPKILRMSLIIKQISSILNYQIQSMNQFKEEELRLSVQYIAC